MPEKWFTCPICGKQFSLKVLLMGHMRSHEKKKKELKRSAEQRERNKRDIRDM